MKIMCKDNMVLLLNEMDIEYEVIKAGYYDDFCVTKDKFLVYNEDPTYGTKEKDFIIDLKKYISKFFTNDYEVVFI